MTPSHPSRYPGPVPKPSQWSRALLAVSLVLTFTAARVNAQTYFNLSTSNYSEDFSTIANWTNPNTGSWSGVAVGGTAAIPDATKITATSATAFSTGATGGVQKGTSNIQLLSTGSGSNSTSTAIDLNLDFGGRTTGILAFNAAEVNNGTGDRPGTLRVYYSINGTSWTEVTGGGLPYTATNNVASSASVNVPIPSAVDGSSTVKLRFYYHNSSTGTAGSRPKISIDNVAVTSSASSVADTTAPTISTLSPVTGSGNVGANSPLQIGFSEGIIAGTGTIKVFKSDGTEVQSLTVPSASVNISGSSVSVPLASPLIAGGSYYIQVSAGAFTDASLNSFAGILDTTTWAFSIDSTSPQVASFSIANNAVGVAPPSALSITFNEAINLVGGKNVTIKKSDGSVVETHEASAFDGVVIAGSVATITLNSSTALDYGASYYVEVDAGAFVDASGNAFAGFTGSTTWTFTTASVPNLSTGAGYSQNFSTFASIATLPLGWSLSGVTATYLGPWGLGTGAGALGFVLGGETVFGYQHTSSTGTVLQTLTLRNTSGSPINDLLISYKGRGVVSSSATKVSRIPIYSVSVAGAPVTALSYSTAEGDNLTRTAAVTGLAIADGATFQVQWSSDRGLGTDSSRQIGVSNVSVAIGTQQFAPTVTDTLALANMSYQSAVFKGEVISDGGSTITARGFVYAETINTTTPTIGGVGSTTLVDSLTGTEPFTGNASGLTPATSYTMRAYATNAIGTSYGSAVTFSTLALPPTLVSSYSQSFAAYNGSIPAGWAAVSSGGAQGYAGAWGNGSGSAGFTGGASSPGVLGYQHTGGTVALTTTLTLFNGTGGLLDQLYISYLGRVSRITEGRSPAFTVSVNGSAIPALAYSTLNNLDATVSTTLTGLQIASGASFTISWVSERGEGSGSSKQIGLGDVLVATSAPTGYEAWRTTNVGGQAADLDYDRDGILNGTEYFMGTAGNAFTTAPGVVSGAVTWPRAAGTTIGSFKVEVSTNLSTWEDASINYAANLDISSSKVAFTLPSNPAKLFVRLSVTP